jgi:hypothetical protein
VTDAHDRLTEDEVLKLLATIDLLSRNAAKHDGDRTDTVRKRLMNALRDALRGE